ncbi:hypothetical protein HKCCE2091_04120 [Rhodobacterales bacterium HKCCE2091]|nr:hypothetical protein [Rhodobacterales bacterium HKCCE2091]
MRRSRLLTTLLAVTTAGTASAQAPRATAIVQSCTATESCSDTGACRATGHLLFVIPVLDFDADPPRAYVAGPMVAEAGAGTFFDTPIHDIAPDLSPAAVFDALPETLGEAIFARVGGFGSREYVVVRPARDIRGLSGHRALTRFACDQVLFP